MDDAMYRRRGMDIKRCGIEKKDPHKISLTKYQKDWGEEFLEKEVSRFSAWGCSQSEAVIWPARARTR